MNFPLSAPQWAGQRAQSGAHYLQAREGRFHGLVWECQVCGAVRNKRSHYTSVPCNPEDGDGDE